VLDFKIDSARHLSLCIIVVSVGALAFAFAAQYGYGLEPCILCIYQRVPFAINIVFGLLAFFLVSRNNMQLWLLRLSGLVFFVGACIAFYHVGVEQHWWQSAASCGGKPITSSITPDQLLKSLQQIQSKACDDIDWSLFGISMASYNIVFFLGLGILTLVGTQKMEKFK
jgi:disulfide bond formation protein DsbB